MSLEMELEETFMSSDVKFGVALHDVTSKLLIEDFGGVRCLDPITLIKVGDVYVPFDLANESHIERLVQAMGFNITFGHNNIITINLNTHTTFRNGKKAAVALCLARWYRNHFKGMF